MVKYFKRSSSIVKARQYPIDLTTYKRTIEKQFKDLGYDIEITDDIIEEKYKKACYVYNDMLKNPGTNKWRDSDFGILKNPEDAFQINWDV